MPEQIVNEIKRLENERGRALINQDWPALAALMGEDPYTCTRTVWSTTRLPISRCSHETGLSEIRAPVVDSTLLRRHRSCHGILFQSVRVKGPETVVDVKAATTQTWVRRDGRWLQNTFQATRTD